MATGSEMKSEMNFLAGARLATLRQKSFGELAALPEVHSEELPVLGKPIRLSTFRENQDVNHLLIVVQAFRETLLGISAQISVVGFVISCSGQVTPAPEEALWEFQ